MIKIILNFCLLLFLMSCSPGMEDYANELMYSFGRKMEKERHVEVIGQGGSILETVDVMIIQFVCSDKYEIKAARKLIVELTESFLSIINNDLRIKPHLQCYPFQPQNLIITVRFFENGMPIESPYLAKVSMEKGKVIYSNSRNQIVATESYEEAKIQLCESIKI